MGKGNIYNSLKEKILERNYGKRYLPIIPFIFMCPHQLQLDIIKMQDITDVVRILRNFS